MHAHLCGRKSFLTLYQIINKPDFPSLADEIADPRPYTPILSLITMLYFFAALLFV